MGHEKVGHIVDLLKESKHNAFPVISWPDGDDTQLGIFEGQVLRSTLIVLLKEKAYGPKLRNSIKGRKLTVQEIRKYYPRWPTASSLRVSAGDREKFLDIEAYYNKSPYSVRWNNSLSRIFHLFRTMGLRHVAVVDIQNRLVGMITRKDIANIHANMTREDFFESIIGKSNTIYELPAEVSYQRYRRLVSMPSSRIR